MSGLDDYSRFYWSVNPAGNLAWNAGLVYDDYPQISLGRSSSFYPSEVSGVFGGIGFNAYSYEPTMAPTRTLSYWLVSERVNSYAPYGLSALYYGDYSIDFWVKINPAASGYQPLFGFDGGVVAYYENGVIGLLQLGYVDVRCLSVLTGAFHHVEFNRSLGVNRIFIDGELQTLSSDIWSPNISVSGGFSIGVDETDYSLRNVDYVIDELRFSTGIARHTANFTPPIAPYTYDAPVTEISSPTDGSISFFAFNGIELYFPEDQRIYATQNGKINIYMDLEQSFTIATDEVIFITQNGRIRFENPAELLVGFYGLTVPAINDGDISFDLNFDVQFQIDEPIVIEVLDSGTIYDLVSNDIQLPISMGVSIIPPLVPPFSFSFTFVNALELQMGFTFKNSLNTLLETSFSFRNSLTTQVSFSFTFKNRILAVNEVEKSLTILNRLLGDGVGEIYEGFIFSKIHGA